MDFTFGRALTRIPVELVWGLHPQDTGSLNSVYEYTDAVLEPRTNFIAPASQLWLKKLCADLYTWAEDPTGPIVGGSVHCPMSFVDHILKARKLHLPLPPSVRA
jgi:hypothetical protein